MNTNFNNLSEEQSNLIILKVLCILEDKKYRNLHKWPFKDVSVDDIFDIINKIYSNKLLKDNFVKFCLNNIESKKQYSLIEGFFNLIYMYENLEKYENCIVLKNIKDSILLDLQFSKT